MQNQGNQNGTGIQGDYPYRDAKEMMVWLKKAMKYPSKWYLRMPA